MKDSRATHILVRRQVACGESHSRQPAPSRSVACVEHFWGTEQVEQLVPNADSKLRPREIYARIYILICH